MRRLIAILLSLWLAPAWAQVPMTGAGKGAPGSSASTATITLTDSSTACNQNDTTGGTLTCALNIGTADSNKKNIVVITLGNSYDASPTAVSIDGVNCTAAGVGSSSGGMKTYTGSGSVITSYAGQIIFAWADVTTGGTKNIVITGGTSVGNGYSSIAVYSVDKTTVLDTAPTFSTGGNVTSATSNPVDVNTGSGGFVIAASQNEALGSATGTTITSSTETMVEDLAFTISGLRYGPIFSKKSGVSVATPFTATFGWTNSGQDLAAIMFWR